MNLWCRGLHFVCDRLAVEDVLHNVQAEWYAFMLVSHSFCVGWLPVGVHNMFHKLAPLCSVHHRSLQGCNFLSCTSPLGRQSIFFQVFLFYLSRFVLRKTSFRGLSSLIHHIWPRKFNFLWTSSGWIILWTILMFVSILFVITLCWCLWAMQAQQYISIVFSALYQTLMSGCFDAVGWETGRAQEHTLIKAGHPLC